ncbi:MULTISPECIES: hypothetical protein [unclassified Microbacterium]|uniref:hypothetical protein n=4 Tax=Microbacterium TaxID=33882 RepID=UPI0011B084BA|nr:MULTISPECIES: hypothetical protein [unclassified Microbacterium]
MSEPQQPPHPPSAQQPPASPPAPPAVHLPAVPQYPAAPQYPATPQYLAAPQHPATPQYQPAPQHQPAPQYSATQQYQPAPQDPTRTGNPLGVAAFVIAAATLAVNLLSSVARPFVYGGDGGFNFMLAVDNGIGILSFFTYVVAMVLALIAVRRSASRLLTGIAIGVAGTGIIGLVSTALTIGLYQYL